MSVMGHVASEAMAWVPPCVDEALRAALVAELTVINGLGEPITHPLIPLWDGQRIYMTSSVLFSKKLEHLKRNSKVGVSVSDPIATAGHSTRCSIQGDAYLVEDDPHETWMRVVPLWREKEPAIDTFLGKRFALPLFFERSLIEITPRRVLYWEDGDLRKRPEEVRSPELAP
jgi:hypothetical protein